MFLELNNRFFIQPHKKIYCLSRHVMVRELASASYFYSPSFSLFKKHYFNSPENYKLTTLRRFSGFCPRSQKSPNCRYALAPRVIGIWDETSLKWRLRSRAKSAMQTPLFENISLYFDRQDSVAKTKSSYDKYIRCAKFEYKNNLRWATTVVRLN